MRKRFLIFISVLASWVSAPTQTPYTWSFTAKKVTDKTYEIHCVFNVEAPWHTYSQLTPDGGPLPTKFTIKKNPLYSLDGDMKENGKMIVKHEDVFGVDVKYFEGKVDFVQLIRLKGNVKTNFSGSVEFMVCNEVQCLPPATKKFSIALN